MQAKMGSPTGQTLTWPSTLARSRQRRLAARYFRFINRADLVIGTANPAAPTGLLFQASGKLGWGMVRYIQ